jgi:hypothetical protein
MFSHEREQCQVPKTISGQHMIREEKNKTRTAYAYVQFERISSLKSGFYPAM